MDNYLEHAGPLLEFSLRHVQLLLSDHQPKLPNNPQSARGFYEELFTFDISIRSKYYYLIISSSCQVILNRPSPFYEELDKNVSTTLRVSRRIILAVFFRVDNF